MAATATDSRSELETEARKERNEGRGGRDRGNIGGGLADLWEKAGHEATRIGRDGVTSRTPRLFNTNFATL